jgi:hypothetical protein
MSLNFITGMLSKTNLYKILLSGAHSQSGELVAPSTAARQTRCGLFDFVVRPAPDVSRRRPDHRPNVDIKPVG